MSSADALRLIGTTVAEKYAVEGLVGEGGFAVVYRATHLIWKRPVALKVFKALAEVTVADRQKLLSDFIQEGALLADLSEKSASICQARDVGMLTTPNGDVIPYMVLEWLEGSSLGEVLYQENERGLPPRSIDEAMHLIEPAAEALALAHKQGVAHRDIKPANIFLLGDPRGEHCPVKLLDFGIAKVVQDAQKKGGAFTKTSGQVTSFTPSYGAPEQFSRSHGATGPWTDVFALALVVVECVTGRSPLEGDDFMQIAYASADKTRRPTPRTLGAGVSDAVEDVFLKALAVSPADRFRTAGKFWNALRGAMGLEPLRTLGTPSIPPPSMSRSSAVPSVPGPASLPRSAAPGSRPVASAGGRAPSTGTGGGPTGPRPPFDSAAGLPPASGVAHSSRMAGVPPSGSIGSPPSGPGSMPSRSAVAVAVEPTMIDPQRLSGSSSVMRTPPSIPTTSSTQPRPGPAPRRAPLFVLGAVVALGLAAAAVVAFRMTAHPAASASATAVAGPPPSAAASVSATAVVAKTQCLRGMVYVEGGPFFMGSNDDLPQEKPAHKVTVDPYCVDVFEVTTEQYKACSDGGRCLRAYKTNEWSSITDHDRKVYDPLCNIREPEERAKHPINCVNWQMANDYCADMGGRLPTEAEWEFATRGKDGRKYPWGDEEPTGGHLNACGKECVEWGKKMHVSLPPMYAMDDGWPTTAPVGSFPAGKSPHGVQDVVGNVWEWVADWYAPYTADAQTNPKGPSDGTQRVIRGGAWNASQPAWVRPTFRYMDDPAKRSHGIGFRCAATPQ
jgi:formylglycine-generating enzyme required for sulfatase activity/serine/threonine protein kinase